AAPGRAAGRRVAGRRLATAYGAVPAGHRLPRRHLAGGDPGGARVPAPDRPAGAGRGRRRRPRPGGAAAAALAAADPLGAHRPVERGGRGAGRRGGRAHGAAAELRPRRRRRGPGPVTHAGPWAATGWRETLAHLGKPQAAVVPLTTGFRVPAAVLTLANRLLPALGVDVPVPRSLRRDGDLTVRRVSDPDEDTVAEVRSALGR